METCRYLPKTATGFNLAVYATDLTSALCFCANRSWTSRNRRAAVNLLLFPFQDRIEAEVGKNGEIKGEMKTRPKRGRNEDKPFFNLCQQT